MAEDKGFEINDRRKAAATDAPADTPGTETAFGGLNEATAPGDTDDFPAVDFMSFVGSLAATALMHMGEKFSPEQPDDMKDLAAARLVYDRYRADG